MDSKENMNKRNMGSQYEKQAASYLEEQGYQILERNYNSRLGEIDIIAYDKDVLAFIEVKYRKDSTFGLPREAVNYKKQQKIRSVAMGFIKQHNLFDKVCRFDVIEILGNDITLLKDCF